MYLPFRLTKEMAEAMGYPDKDNWNKNFKTKCCQAFNCLRKSAALISWCAAAGAWVIDAPEAASALQEFGRAVGVADAGPGATDGVGHREHRLRLPDEPLAERVLHAQQLVLLYRHAGFVSFCGCASSSSLCCSASFSRYICCQLAGSETG